MDITAKHRKSYPQCMFWKKRRYMLTLLAFLGFFNMYTARVNLSVAIVAMNSPYSVTLDNGTVVEKQDFNWDSKMRGFVLSSFFYGYMSTQLLGGWLGARFGGKVVYGVGVGVTALLTVITPPLVNISVYLLVLLRILEGGFEGIAYPCMHALWAQWAPPHERSLMASIAYAGASVGTVTALPVSGLLGATVGWPSIFYLSGAVGLAFSAIWFAVVKDCPEDDPDISPEELKYIKESLGHNDTNHRVKHPWRKFLTSLPVWAIVGAHFCEFWGFYTLQTQLPTFLKDVFNFHLAEAGFISSLPYLVMAVTLVIAGSLSNWLQSSGSLSITQVRKLFTCGALAVQACCMILAAYLKTAAGVVLCLVVGLGLESFALASFGVNHLDIAPRHASMLFGISNTFASISGIVSPLITGYIVIDKIPEQWHIVFYVSSAIYLLGAVLYGLFASGEVQPWAVENTTVSCEKTNTVDVIYNKDVSND
uniref:Sialin n=1 Tax=Graphocephala atropunctata TaxID=36148 RepID=A0A1B6KKS8_9HEMI